MSKTIPGCKCGSDTWIVKKVRKDPFSDALVLIQCIECENRITINLGNPELIKVGGLL